MMLALSLLAAAGLAAVHVFSQQLRVLAGVPRSRLLSFVGGMAVAFVILRLLPALGEHQQTIGTVAATGIFGTLKNHVYIVVLISIAIYYGLEQLARRSKEKRRGMGESARTSYRVFWLHMLTLALMNVLIGYLLIGQAKQGNLHLSLFFLAMLFKFLVNDHGLHRLHKDLYDDLGRWVLVLAVFLGWGINYLFDVPRVGPALFQAFIAGGVLLNVLKEELPEERQSRYWAFALGTSAYATLLVAIDILTAS